MNFSFFFCIFQDFFLYIRGKHEGEYPQFFDEAVAYHVKNVKRQKKSLPRKDKAPLSVGIYVMLEHSMFWIVIKFDYAYIIVYTKLI